MPSALQIEIAEAIKPMVREISELKEELRQLRKDTPDRLLTVQEAAKVLGVCDQTVRRRVQDGSLKSQRTGHKIMFNKKDLV